MKIAAFFSHPTQHMTPLWQELSRRPHVTLKVFYYSQHAVKPSLDPEFGVKFAWDVDLLAGHDYEFLPRLGSQRLRGDLAWWRLNGRILQRLREGWDAVYVAGYADLNNWIVLLGCRRLGIPVLCHSDVNILTALKKGRLKRAIKRLVVPAFLKRVSVCLAIGDNSKAYFRSYGVPEERTCFCPIPVDIERFRRRVQEARPEELERLRSRYCIPVDKRLILFSGKLVPRKRPLDLVAAVRQLNRPDVAAMFIGDGQLRAQVELQGGPQAVVTGFVNQADIPLLLQMGTLSVMPSSYDAHPLAVTESLCVGVPVILSDLCGCYGPNDVLRDGEDGLVYPCGDVAALAGHLRALLEDEALRRRMAQRGLELAQTQSPRQSAEALLQAAREVQ